MALAEAGSVRKDHQSSEGGRDEPPAKLKMAPGPVSKCLGVIFSSVGNVPLIRPGVNLFGMRQKNPWS